MTGTGPSHRRIRTLVVLTALLSARWAFAIDRALLIGINDYASSEIADLRGTHNDVALIRQTLIDRYHFSPENIRVLRDGGATRQKMLDAIEVAARTTGPADFLYLHYSGHGSRVEDRSGDEEDGLDETIVPQDGRMPGTPDILDDEIDARLALIRGKALVVFDSCHSGTVTRSASGVRPRAVPPDTRSDLYPAVRTRSIVAVPELHHVLLTGAADFEEALDGPIDGTYYGYFTYALARAMQASPGSGITPRELHDQTRILFSAIDVKSPFIRRPEPQLEGPSELLGAVLLGSREPLPTSDPLDRLFLLASRSQIQVVEMDLAGPGDCTDDPPTRGLRIAAGDGEDRTGHVRHIRRPGSARTTDNSLQVRLHGSREAYVSLLYAGSDQNTTLIFPDEHGTYLPQGRLSAGEPVCVPDSLQPSNQAGFYWDLGPPHGTDRLILIATPERELARKIREQISSTAALDDMVRYLESLPADSTELQISVEQLQVLP